MKVLILGGAGFVGRHVSDSALASGLTVVIGTRFPARAAAKVPRLAACEFRQLRLEEMLTPELWHAQLEGIDTVINCVGILRERWGETYEHIHHLAPSALATACAQRTIRLVQVSALGLHADARSGFLRSKLRGEAALRASGADWSIVRPSLLDGEGGYGAHWLRLLSGWPVHFVPSSARGRIAVLDVRVLGEAIIALARRPGANGWREVELGGTRYCTMREHLAELRRAAGLNPARQLSVPYWAARLLSHLCDLLHVTPYSFGHLELMGRDNVPMPNRLTELLPAQHVDMQGSKLSGEKSPMPLEPGLVVDSP